MWTGENEAFRKRRRRVAITPTFLATVLLFIAVAAVVSTKIKNKNNRESFANITAITRTKIFAAVVVLMIQ